MDEFDLVLDVMTILLIIAFGLIIYMYLDNNNRLENEKIIINSYCENNFDSFFSSDYSDKEDGICYEKINGTLYPHYIKILNDKAYEVKN